MSTVQSDTSQPNQASQQLRNSFAACRLQFNWLGTSKTLSPDQKERAASSFDASADSISAGKRLWDTSHPSYRAVTSVRRMITTHWKNISLPYPESGTRLIKQRDVAGFDAAMHDYRGQLQAAVEELQTHFGELKQAARVRLGRLFNEADYPDDVTELFQVSWDFPTVEPPNYLRELVPNIFEEQSRQVAERFEQAVVMAETAFQEEFASLLSHLTERLSGGEDGQPKVFRNSVIVNLTEFIARFRHLNLRSNEELEGLIASCEQIVRGVQPQSLRDSEQLRRHISTQLARVQSSLDQMMVDRPRRNIQRREPDHS